ncbi:MAG: ClbS/DfsB family four-helix bundle protein [Chloroflexi bacterium]|nr:ClbS/DfsB family four-helix bundle protein [Chloroflexota bacterium]
MMTKPQLLEKLKTRRAEWDALLNSVDQARMDISGAAGHWSVKDIVSHITAYERWLVEWLTAASQNTFPAPSPLDDADVEQRNARVYELTRNMSSLDVLNDARQTFAELLEIIKALPDEYFDDPQSAAWFMKPYWSKMKTVPDAVINLSVDHYEEHIPSLKAWANE